MISKWLKIFKSDAEILKIVIPVSNKYNVWYLKETMKLISAVCGWKLQCIFFVHTGEALSCMRVQAWVQRQEDVEQQLMDV